MIESAKFNPCWRTKDANQACSKAYGKREPLVYQSGFLTALPGNGVAPRCFGVVEQAADETSHVSLLIVQCQPFFRKHDPEQGILDATKSRKMRNDGGEVSAHYARTRIAVKGF